MLTQVQTLRFSNPLVYSVSWRNHYFALRPLISSPHFHQWGHAIKPLRLEGILRNHFVSGHGSRRRGWGSSHHPGAGNKGAMLSVKHIKIYSTADQNRPAFYHHHVAAVQQSSVKSVVKHSSLPRQSAPADPRPCTPVRLDTPAQAESTLKCTCTRRSTQRPHRLCTCLKSPGLPSLPIPVTTHSPVHSLL